MLSCWFDTVPKLHPTNKQTNNSSPAAILFAIAFFVCFTSDGGDFKPARVFDGLKQWATVIGTPLAWSGYGKKNSSAIIKVHLIINLSSDDLSVTVDMLCCTCAWLTHSSSHVTADAVRLQCMGHESPGGPVPLPPAPAFFCLPGPAWLDWTYLDLSWLWKFGSIWAWWVASRVQATMLLPGGWRAWCRWFSPSTSIIMIMSMLWAPACQCVICKDLQSLTARTSDTWMHMSFNRQYVP